MTDTITIHGKVTDEGELIVQLPPDAPRGEVEVVVRRAANPASVSPDHEIGLDEEFEALMNDPATFTGSGLSAEEIENSPLYGSWANRSDVPDSAAYVEQLRQQNRERRISRGD